MSAQRDGAEPDAGRAAARMRRATWALALAACAGSLAELALSEHVEEPLQIVAFGLVLLATLALLAPVLRPTRGVLRGARGALGLVFLGGAYGVWLHFAGNLAFEKEIQPTLRTAELLGPALLGAAPLLAPGILALIACLGWIATIDHPALDARAAEAGRLM